MSILYDDYTPHPVADMFPSMFNKDKQFPDPDMEWDDFVEDIRANGIVNPIVVMGKIIIDGRNRYRAAKLTKQKLVFREWTGPTDDESITKFIISSNIKRKHYSTFEKIRILRNLREREEEIMAQQRPSEGHGDRSGRRDHVLGKMVGLGHSTVSKVVAVENADPTLLDKVVKNETTVAAAYREVKQKERERRKEQLAAIKESRERENPFFPTLKKPEPKPEEPDLPPPQPEPKIFHPVQEKLLNLIQLLEDRVQDSNDSYVLDVVMALRETIEEWET